MRLILIGDQLLPRLLIADRSQLGLARVLAQDPHHPGRSPALGLQNLRTALAQPPRAPKPAPPGSRYDVGKTVKRGCTALLAVVAIVVTLYTTGDEPPPAQQSVTTVIGDCNAVGNSTSDCAGRAGE
ncbi:hypothetical protein ACIBG8_09255 [Nonomuraea sp. NPDC050556]|uniref:hypothetical protein n=1 Tax=Nonomuraea sp. NPDC050556 TaxID=3364369 RepID=UPI00379A1419